MLNRSNNLSKSTTSELNCGLVRDVFRSIFVHTCIVLITLIPLYSNDAGVVELNQQNSIAATNGYKKSNSIDKLEKLKNEIPNQVINASLIDKKTIQEAINRQASEAKNKIIREQKLKQQEKQLNQLKKITDQQALKLKQEAAIIKKEAEKAKQEKEQIKKQYQELQRSEDKLKQRSKELLLQEEKLKKSQETIEKKKVQENLIIPEKNTINAEQNVTKVLLEENLPAKLQSIENYDEINSNIVGQGINQQHDAIVKYKTIWTTSIINNRKRTTLFPLNITCSIEIKLLPDGKLESVKLAKSSGNVAYDAFSEQAVYKSEPFQMPEDPVLKKELIEMRHILVFEDKEYNEE